LFLVTCCNPTNCMDQSMYLLLLLPPPPPETGCTTNLLSMDGYENILTEVKQFVNQLRAGLAETNDMLVAECGTTNPQFFSDMLGTLLGYTCTGLGILWQLISVIDCSSWLPLYYTAVYSATCYNGVYGVWAVAATQFLTFFMVCIVLTFRCVFFELEIPKEEAGEAQADLNPIDQEELGVVVIEGEHLHDDSGADDEDSVEKNKVVEEQNNSQNLDDEEESDRLVVGQEHLHDNDENDIDEQNVENEEMEEQYNSHSLNDQEALGRLSTERESLLHDKDELDFDGSFEKESSKAVF